MTGKLESILVALICCTAIVSVTAAHTFYWRLETAGLTKADAVVEVSCKSDSMGLMFGCGDEAIVRSVGEYEDLVDGEIYIFDSPYERNATVIHRLIWHNETHAMFKGDNNRVADPIVPREDLVYKVISVRLE